jgi:hypothetical protein
MGQGRRQATPPSEAGDVGHPGQDAPDGGLVDPDPDRRIGAGPEPGVEVLLDRGDGHVEALFAPEGDGDVDPGLVLLDLDALDPGVGVDLAPAGSIPRMVRTVLASRVSAPSPRGIPKAPASRAGPGCRGQVVAGHDHLDDPARGRCEGFTTTGPGSAKDRAKAFRAWSASPSPIWRASA